MGSRAITADSSQTATRVYFSIVVLVGLVLNAAFGWWADPLAPLGVVVLISEGREALTAEHPRPPLLTFGQPRRQRTEWPIETGTGGAALRPGAIHGSPDGSADRVQG